MHRLLTLIALPHVSTYKSRWVRRVMIVLNAPREIAVAVYNTLACAKFWWNWTPPPQG